jgi:hypothetical protein
MASRKSQRERRIDELLARLDEGDILLAIELGCRFRFESSSILNLGIARD